MGINGRENGLGAEKLERRIAPGRLAYDVPPEDGTSGDDSGSIETSPTRVQKQRLGKGRQKSELVAR